VSSVPAATGEKARVGNHDSAAGELETPVFNALILVYFN
jgi:hypothetical protein